VRARAAGAVVVLLALGGVTGQLSLKDKLLSGDVGGVDFVFGRPLGHDFKCKGFCSVQEPIESWPLIPRHYEHLNANQAIRSYFQFHVAELTTPFLAGEYRLTDERHSIECLHGDIKVSFGGVRVCQIFALLEGKEKIESRSIANIFRLYPNAENKKFAIDSWRLVQPVFEGHPRAVLSKPYLLGNSVGVLGGVDGIISGTQGFSYPVYAQSGYYNRAESNYRRDNKHPLGPVGHLPLGIQILFGAVLFAGGLVGALVAFARFLDRGFIETFYVCLLLSIVSGSLGLIILSYGLSAF